MGNKYLDKVKIDSEDLKAAIRNAGYSLRSLAEHLDRSDRTIRTYLGMNEMPAKLYKDICDLIDYKRPPQEINYYFQPEYLWRVRFHAENNNLGTGCVALYGTVCIRSADIFDALEKATDKVKTFGFDNIAIEGASKEDVAEDGGLYND